MILKNENIFPSLNICLKQILSFSRGVLLKFWKKNRSTKISQDNQQLMLPKCNVFNALNIVQHIHHWPFVICQEFSSDTLCSDNLWDWQQSVAKWNCSDYAETYFSATNDTKYDGVFAHCVYSCNNSCINSCAAQIFKKTTACYLVRIHSTWMGKSSKSLQVSNTFSCTLIPLTSNLKGSWKKNPGKSKFELTNHTIGMFQKLRTNESPS